MFFISLQKLFSFSRKSKFRILDIQISGRQQMLKHKTRNTFDVITWEVNTSLTEIWPVYVILQKKTFYQKFYKNCDLKVVPGPFAKN